MILTTSLSLNKKFHLSENGYRASCAGHMESGVILSTETEVESRWDITEGRIAVLTELLAQPELIANCCEKCIGNNVEHLTDWLTRLASI